MLLVSAALMITVASLFGKMTYYSRTATAETEISQEQRVTNFLIRHGWTAIGGIEPDRWLRLGLSARCARRAFRSRWCRRVARWQRFQCE